MSASFTAAQTQRQMRERQYLLNQLNRKTTITLPDVIGEADAEVVASDARLRSRLAGSSGSTLVSSQGKGKARITLPTVVGL